MQPKIKNAICLLDLFAFENGFCSEKCSIHQGMRNQKGQEEQTNRGFGLRTYESNWKKNNESASLRGNHKQANSPRKF